MEIQDMKQLFIDSAVHVVARDGLEKTTTKAIARQAKLNEAYIYKCFSGKDELLSLALQMEDKNFAEFLYETLPIMKMESLTWKERAFILWSKSWDFILEERDDCIFYINFYFAAIGVGSVYREHLLSYRPLIKRVAPAFKPGTNMDMLIHQIFCTMLFFASQVMNGDLPYNEDTTRYTFEQIYFFLAPHVRPELMGSDVPPPPNTCFWGVNILPLEHHHC